LTQYSLKNPSEQDRLRRAIGSAIASLEAAPEPVVFDTEYSLENGKFMLKGRRR
jgi:hypothetical protein